MISTRDRRYNNRRIATAWHEGGSKRVVIFCHGFRGASVGPRRLFVRAAEKLAQRGISSLRFDQYGSGNSDGDFIESRFDDWVQTIVTISRHYLDDGYRVGLWGQSMGGSAVINAAAGLPELSAVVSWVPDPTINPPTISGSHVEEGGERVSWDFWRQAHAAHTADKLFQVTTPTYIVQCTGDEYVDAANRDAITSHARENHVIQTYEGYSHSSWSYNQAEEIITQSGRAYV